MMTEVEHLLICLTEECAKVIQAADKALRFGFVDTGYDGGRDNRAVVAHELNDLAAIVGMLLEAGVELPGLYDPESVSRKREKVQEMMSYARDRGTLERSPQSRERLKEFALCFVNRIATAFSRPLTIRVRGSLICSLSIDVPFKRSAK